MIKLIKRLIFRDNPNIFNLWSVFDEIGKDIITYGTEGEKPMSNLIMLTGMQGKKFLVNKTFITVTSFYKHNGKEYTLLETKKNTRLIAAETPKEIFKLIEKSEVKEKALVNFIKLTRAGNKTDVYVNVNSITALDTQTENVRIVYIQDGWLFVFETIEEILAKIEEITK